MVEQNFQQPLFQSSLSHFYYYQYETVVPLNILMETMTNRYSKRSAFILKRELHVILKRELYVKMYLITLLISVNFLTVVFIYMEQNIA